MERVQEWYCSRPVKRNQGWYCSRYSVQWVVTVASTVVQWVVTVASTVAGGGTLASTVAGGGTLASTVVQWVLQWLVQWGYSGETVGKQCNSRTRTRTTGTTQGSTHPLPHTTRVPHRPHAQSGMHPGPVHWPVDTRAWAEVSKMTKLTPMGCSENGQSVSFRALTTVPG